MPCSGRPAGPGSRTFFDTCAALDAPTRARIGAALTVRRGRPDAGGPVGGRRGECRRRPHLRRLRPLRRRHATDASPPRSARCRCVATGSPYAVAPDRIRKPRRRPVPGLHPFYRSWLANGWDAPAPTLDPSAVEWRTIAGVPIPDDPPITATLPDAGEPAARARGRGSAAIGLTELRRPSATSPALDGTSRMSPFLKLGAIHPRTLLARSRTGRRRPSAANWHGASSTPPCSTTRPPPHGSSFQPHMERMDYDSGVDRRSPVRMRGQRVDRVSTRRCRDAPAPRGRLDAQPGADDHRVVPRERPAHRLDPRRTALHGPPDRRRPRQQPARLAVDGRDGDRRRAVFPDLQPGEPEPEVRSRRRLHPPLGARAGGVAEHRDPRAVAPTAGCSAGVPRTDRRPRRRAGRLPRPLPPRAISSVAPRRSRDGDASHGDMGPARCSCSAPRDTSAAGWCRSCSKPGTGCGC